jgi:hypothetical protein
MTFFITFVKSTQFGIVSGNLTWSKKHGQCAFHRTGILVSWFRDYGSNRTNVMIICFTVAQFYLTGGHWAILGGPVRAPGLQAGNKVAHYRSEIAIDAARCRGQAFRENPFAITLCKPSNYSCSRSFP